MRKRGSAARIILPAVWNIFAGPDETRETADATRTARHCEPDPQCNDDRCVFHAGDTAVCNARVPFGHASADICYGRPSDSDGRVAYSNILAGNFTSEAF